MLSTDVGMPNECDTNVVYRYFNTLGVFLCFPHHISTSPAEGINKFTTAVTEAVTQLRSQPIKYDIIHLTHVPNYIIK